MLAVTLCLGMWQVQRLHWKRALLAAIDRGEAEASEPLARSPPPFRKVVASGRFLPGTARYGIELRSIPGLGPTMGSQVLNVMIAAPGWTVLVDRGWAPLEDDAVVPDGEARIEGYIRPPERSHVFGVKDDPAARRFYVLDPAAIGLALGHAEVAPYTVVALGPAASGTFPSPAATLPRPPNDHLSYAITWFGLSAALMAVFGVYLRRTLRRGMVQ